MHFPDLNPLDCLAWDRFRQAVYGSSGVNTLMTLLWQMKEQCKVLSRLEYVRRGCQFLRPFIERVIQEHGTTSRAAIKTAEATDFCLLPDVALHMDSCCSLRSPLLWYKSEVLSALLLLPEAMNMQRKYESTN